MFFSNINTTSDESQRLTMAASSNGNAGCPCINISDKLSSLTDRSCILADGSSGVHLTLGGACVSPTYGSSACLQHEMIHDPICNYSAITSIVAPPYCFRPWCYVDVESCIKDSDERVYRSSYFDFDSEIDVYFSYSTCNSTADDWLEAQKTDLVASLLEGANILGNVPTYTLPCE